MSQDWRIAMARYDLNVWDYIGYDTDYEREGWRVDVYECDENWQHADDPVKIIYLNENQAKMMTLGVAKELGGEYDYDTDFWIEPNFLLKTYSNVPRKLRRYIENLDTGWDEEVA
jgi:hypothetical protein